MNKDNLIEFAKEQCEIFPEDSYMGKYLRETIKILQAEPCEDAISREDVIKAIDRHTFNTDDGLCLDEDISIILEEVAPKQEHTLEKVITNKIKAQEKYEKDFNDLKEQILKEGDTLLTKRELLERFCEIDKEYNGRPWNLLQILANINVLIGQKFCEDCVSRKSLKHKLQERHDFFVDAYGGFINLPQKDKARVDAITNCIAMVVNEPPVKPARKKGKWIIDDKEYNRIWDCHCSECKKDPQGFIGGSEDWWVVRLPKYCPYCGCLMESKQ